MQRLPGPLVAASHCCAPPSGPQLTSPEITHVTCVVPQDRCDCHNYGHGSVEIRDAAQAPSRLRTPHRTKGRRHWLQMFLDGPSLPLGNSTQGVGWTPTPAELTLHVCACMCRGVRRGEPAPAAQRCHSHLSLRPGTATVGRGPIGHVSCRPGPST